jgi:RHS repeat-associated protein
VHSNHLGVPQVYTNASGAAIATPAYTLPGFPGQLRTLADLYYNKYRDYDTSTGRYVQADPIGLSGGNSPYAYAMGNPVRYTDPTGEFPALALPAAGAGGAGIGAFCATPVGWVVCGGGAVLAVGALIWYNWDDDCVENDAGGTSSGGMTSQLRRSGDSGRYGGGRSNNPPQSRRDGWCEINHESERAQCKEAWQFLSSDGLMQCNRTAFVRYSECLSRGGPHNISSPLYLPFE